ncbi:hypothetical protein DVH24_014404 [Malus domestica]|uniref:Uncharacterized protein n=1 Tax=Malus domestica TaxID=3750 RepID=A0A498IRC6_MALDO|nr:hypothetical protein DVH24_014404 [Malus domestica]
MEPDAIKLSPSAFIIQGLNFACFSLFQISGFHLKLPLVTHFEPVQVTLQIDQVTLVRDIPCGTKEGVMINFDKIEIRLCDIIL